MRRMTIKPDAPFDDHVAALGAAYERYIGRLNMMERLRRQGAEELGSKYAPQIAHARSLVEEAYLHWRTLAELHLSAALRAYDARRRRA
jgi:hypothetical protein